MISGKDCFEKYGFGYDIESTDLNEQLQFERKYMTLYDIPTAMEIGAIPKRVYCNKDLVKPLDDAFKHLIERNLIDELKTYDGCFNPRPIRGYYTRFNEAIKNNDIDEAMRLGFNWTKGPFEMLEEIGVETFFGKIDDFKGNAFLENLSKNRNQDFYGSRQKYTDIETFGKAKKKALSVDGNSSAQIYRFNDYNIVEFTTKANALDYDSMDALKKATDKPLIIINESMQFSAGVNLSYTMDFANKNDFKSIEKFIRYFQETCKHLKYSNHPVVSAPSGLTLGGGFEVMVQSNFVASHTNIVVGLVETIVGLIPAGGGCKEMLARWLDTDEAKKDPHYAPLKVFDIIGYGKTATSPIEAEPLKYLRPEDKKIMNRNSLLEVSKKILDDNKEFKTPTETEFKLPGKEILIEMNKIIENLYNEKIIRDHGVTVAKELAHVLSGGDTTIDKTLSEDDLFKLELDAFMRLIETKETQDRIKHTLATGKPLIN